jgi:hypothetical protein
MRNNTTQLILVEMLAVLSGVSLVMINCDGSPLWTSKHYIIAYQLTFIIRCDILCSSEKSAS